MTKLVLVDSMAILHRAYHALPPLTTKHGEPIGAIYGLVSMLLRIIQDLKPTHLALCFDRKEQTFRQKEFVEYQAHRPEVMDELSSQFEKARDVAGAIGIPAYSMAGYEADDVIGTLATKATKMLNDKSQMLNKTYTPPSTIHHTLIDEVIIVTGDRDILQLVDDEKNIKLYMPVLGLSNAKMYGEKETEERIGVLPKLIPDYKGLVGDPSDNYKGIAGIGPKTATSLIKEFGGYEEMWEYIDKSIKGIKGIKSIKGDNRISERILEKLIAGRESGDISYRLAKIVTDVPIEFDFEDMKKWRIDSDRVLDLFQNEYGFKTLTKRVKEVGEKMVSENQGSLFGN